MYLLFYTCDHLSNPCFIAIFVFGYAREFRYGASTFFFIYLYSLVVSTRLYNVGSMWSCRPIGLPSTKHIVKKHGFNLDLSEPFKPL